MPSITVRNLDEAIKHKLRMRATAHGRSMEDEVRTILRTAVEQAAPPTGSDLLQRIHSRFAPLGDVALSPPEREAIRDPPVLDGERRP